MARRALSVLGALDLVLRLSSAQAAPPSPGEANVRVRFRDCVPARFGDGAIERAVDLELQGRELEIELIVDCGSRSSILVVATDAQRGATFARRVPLDDVADADRPRVLALALGELLESIAPDAPRAHDAKRAPEPPRATMPPIDALETPPSSAPATAAAAIAVTPAVRDRPAGPARQRSDDSRQTRALTIAGAFKARWLPAPDTRLLGGSLGLGVGALGGALEAFFGGAKSSIGDASFGVAALVTHYAPLVLDHGAFRARTGLALGVGVTWVNARADPGVNQHDVLRGYVDLRATQALELELAARLSALASVEFGRSSGVQANADGRALGATGGWFGAAGVGVTARY